MPKWVYVERCPQAVPPWDDPAAPALFPGSVGAAAYTDRMLMLIYTAVVALLSFGIGWVMAAGRWPWNRR